MSRYRKKPVVIEAVRWTGGNADQIKAFVGHEDEPGERAYHHSTTGSICIPTLEGPMWATMGDWIIRGVKGEFYPCKPDIFAMTYELEGS